MFENEIINSDEKALRYFGKAYLITPRVLMDQFFSLGKSDNLAAKLHGFLYIGCNYADSIVCVHGQPVVCHKGEYITSYAELALWMNVSPRSVRRYMNLLVENSFVEVKPIADRICVRICGYVEFTVSDERAEKNESNRYAERGTRQSDKKASYDGRKAMEKFLLTNGHKPRIDLLKEL